MRHQSLFVVREAPQGLLFKPDFLTVQEERDLLALLHTLPFYKFKLHGVAAKRRVLHFGLRYALESRMLSTAPEIPSQFEPLRQRAAEFAGLAPDEFSQILVNEYCPGTGITGDARNLWQHRIAPIEELRYSITMRTLRKQSNDND
jgi:alkylated DNA repair dioxygenase AlkB